MSLLKFIKYYYEKTHKNLPDEVSSRSIMVSKKQRIPTIVFSYLFLLLILTTLPFVIIYCKNFYLVMMLIFYFFLGLICIMEINEAEFNLLLIMRCYNIYKKDNVYCTLLKSDWFTGQLISILEHNLNIKGMKYGRISFGSLSSKLRKIYYIPYNNIKVKLIFKPNMLIVKYNKNKKIFKELYASNKLLFDDVKGFIVSN